ncbi:MAG: type IX secretion system membrane protein PorP/SprF [Lewinellaceae bacterium]|nr:type IX secretion system membrane protein PorP/SprF [Lewinellaceae bacterium]
MLRYILLAAISVLFFQRISAQQEQQYTQFMFNKLAYNPGYAGSFESPTLTAIYRNQWLGLDGAPKTQLVSFTQPLFNNRVGIGANLVRNTIGISRSLTAELDYAFRIPIGRGVLGAGLQFSLRHLRQNWTDSRLLGSQPLMTDNAIPLEPKSKIVVNAGFGLFYTGPKWYIGAAVPRLVTNNIDFAEYGDVFSREERHINGMAGVSFDLADGIEMTPQILVKYVNHAPIDADVNVSILIQRKFFSGITYRIGGNQNGAGESLDLMFGVQATRNIFLCASYDIGLSALRKYHNGSMEVTARYWLNVPEGEDIVDPRYPW